MYKEWRVQMREKSMWRKIEQAVSRLRVGNRWETAAHLLVHKHTHKYSTYESLCKSFETDDGVENTWIECDGKYKRTIEKVGESAHLIEEKKPKRGEMWT